MKTRFIVLYLIFCPIFLYSLESKNTTLFTLNILDTEHIMLSEPIESVLKKIGTPDNCTEKLFYPEKEEYNTVILDYKDYSIEYWKGFPEIRKITLKNSNISVSNEMFSIEKSLLTEVLECYQESEVSDYQVTENESHEKIISIVFRTRDHDYMFENAGKCDYVNIMYTFDYKTKICKEIMLVVYDD